MRTGEPLAPLCSFARSLTVVNSLTFAHRARGMDTAYAVREHPGAPLGGRAFTIGTEIDATDGKPRARQRRG
jgi:hypothetical protein